MSFFFYSAIGYCCSVLGLLVGGLLSLFAHRLQQEKINLLLSFSAGFLLAFVCFEMLPVAFDKGLLFGLLVLISGSLVAIWLESFRSRSRLLLPTLALGLALHKLPEGLALGALLSADFKAGLSLAFIIALHCIPEGLALAMFFHKSGIKYGRILFYIHGVGLPMALGAGIGAAASLTSPWLHGVSLCFSGGIMIYLACCEILPEATEKGHRVLTILGAILGFLGGVWLMCK